VEASVGGGVESSVEFDQLSPVGGPASLQVRLFGALAISRNGVPVSLPASRKVPALLAYLLLAPRAVTRSQLCELLWDVPNDPRGELRWCLSKIRRAVDQPGRRRVDARADTIRLDLTDCFVDAIEISRATQDGIETLSVDRLRMLAALFAGDFLDGLDVDRSPAFSSWLMAQRRRFRGCQAAVLEHLIRSMPDDEAFPHLEKWLQLAPFDRRVHETLLNALARHGRIREGEEHLATTARLFEAEGLDHAPLRERWRAAREKAETSARVQVAASPPATASGSSDAAVVVPAPRRASVAVMPFVDQSVETRIPGGPADGLAHDVITRLAKLRNLFVIAQGTVFALRERHIAPEEAGRMLNVDYIVSGSLQRHGQRLTVAVELAETHRSHRLGGGLQSNRGRRVSRARPNRRQDRRFHRPRDRNRRAQPRHSAAAEFARRMGGASSRPVAHVPVQPGRQRAGPAFFRNRVAARSHLRARLCRALLHAFPERLPGLGGSRRGDRPGVCGRWPKPHGRRP
jgi:DNA-binding SARP family transcriptional activator